MLQLTFMHIGNRYIVSFVDYFTKRLEAFPMTDRKAGRIARFFVEQVVCCRGIPEQLLSDCGTNFRTYSWGV